MLNVDLRLIGLAHLGGILLQMAHRFKQMVHTAVKRGKALVQMRRHDAVGGFGKVAGHEGELLIVALHAQQDAPQRDDADAAVVVGVGSGEQVVFKVCDGVFHPVQHIDVISGQGRKSSICRKGSCWSSI